MQNPRIRRARKRTAILCPDALRKVRREQRVFNRDSAGRVQNVSLGYQRVDDIVRDVAEVLLRHVHDRHARAARR
jgi:hypothetical protein